MAAGTPVVAVEAPGVMDVLGEGGGVLTPAEAGAFAEVVLELLADQGRRAELGREAAAAAQRFAIPNATAGLIDAYRVALDWPRRGQRGKRC
jgi:glycosyltransferase involved in cell wall biosynthesis